MIRLVLGLAELAGAYVLVRVTYERGFKSGVDAAAEAEGTL